MDILNFFGLLSQENKLVDVIFGPCFSYGLSNWQFMKMKTWGICYALVVVAAMLFLNFAKALPMSSKNDLEVKLEPLESIVYAGEKISFTCSYPINASFNWMVHDGVRPYEVTRGMANTTNSVVYWSRLTIPSVRRTMSGEITCSVTGNPNAADAFLIVNGVQIGGVCTNENDCITDKARCLNGICSCPQDDVLLQLTESGYEVCRKMIYRLYDPCEFTEQCFHLVDVKSVCSDKGECVCAPWAADLDGKCVSRGELAFNKNQELYRVGLVAVTCLIIVIVAASLWVTLRKCCQNERSDGQLRSITQPDEQTGDEVTMEIMEDKPPSYDDALESSDVVADPPNFKEALTSSITAKKFLRQSSAPAGQLLTCTAIINTNPEGKPNVQTPKLSG